jgi:hypothetical protein
VQDASAPQLPFALAQDDETLPPPQSHDQAGRAVLDTHATPAQQDAELELPFPLVQDDVEAKPSRPSVWELWRGAADPDLHQIVRRLLTPDQVGILISRADIAAIGHALGLPAPLAARERMLLELFDAAGQFDMLPALLDGLGELLRPADEIYAELAAAHPAWDAHGRAWRGRVADGLALLERLAYDYQQLRRMAQSVV